MEAVSWTTLAILAAFSLGVLALQVGQNARIDAVRDRMTDKFEQVNERLSQLSADLQAFRNNMEQRMDRLEGRLQEHEAQHNL